MSGFEFNFFNHVEVYDLPTLRRRTTSLRRWRRGVQGYHETFAFMTNFDIPPERFDAWVTEAADLRDVMSQLTGFVIGPTKRRLFLEKTPTNVYAFKHLASVLPEVPIIHVVRDGRDVVTSLMKRDFSLFRAGSRWLYDTSAGLAARGARRYLEIRYEDLVADPPGVTRQVWRHVGLDDPSSADELPRPYAANWRSKSSGAAWEQVPTDPVSTRSIGRFRDTLDASALSLLYRIRLSRSGERRAGAPGRSFRDLLLELNYEVDSLPPDASESDAWRARLLEAGDYARRVGRHLRRRAPELPRRLTYIS